MRNDKRPCILCILCILYILKIITINNNKNK